MNKKQLAENVMKAVKASGNFYKVLDGDELKPKHIRIEGWGDIWPSTSTFKHGGKFYRKNYQELCKLLSVAPAPKAKPKYQELENRVKDLEEYCSFLDAEIERIKSHLVI